MCLLIKLVSRKLIIKVLFNDFLVKNGGYTFLIRLNLMFTMSLWKEYELLQILIGLSIGEDTLWNISFRLFMRRSLIRVSWHLIWSHEIHIKQRKKVSTNYGRK